MKKLILSAIAVFAFASANAQEVKFGLKGGVNFASVTGDAKLSNRTGFLVGGLAEIKVSDKFAVQPELLFNSVGGTDSGVTVSLNYISIPVMAKYFVAEKFSLEAGPYVGFLASATASASGSSVDIKDSLSSTDFGLGFGGGYDFTDNISAGLRYNLGLANIEKNSTFKSHNSAFTLAVAYKF